MSPESSGDRPGNLISSVVKSIRHMADPERRFHQTVNPGRAFSRLEIDILGNSLGQLVHTDFDSTAGPGHGTMLGLTNEQIARTGEKLAKRETMNSGDLNVLYTSTLEILVKHQSDDEDPAIRAILPRVKKLHGKLLKLRGFDNKVVKELLHTNI